MYQNFEAILEPTAENNELKVVANGKYTVNWGDGECEEFNENEEAFHKYKIFRRIVVRIFPKLGCKLVKLDFSKSSIYFTEVYIKCEYLKLLKLQLKSPLVISIYKNEINKFHLNFNNINNNINFSIQDSLEGVDFLLIFTKYCLTANTVMLNLMPEIKFSWVFLDCHLAANSQLLNLFEGARHYLEFNGSYSI
jgi:hypothetical protein